MKGENANPKPLPSAAFAGSDLFLLNPKHRAVIEGERQHYGKVPVRDILLFGLLMLLLFGILAFNDISDMRLAQFGVPVSATVLSHSTGRHRTRGREITDYYISYQYAVSELDSPFTSRVEVSHSLYSSYPDGSNIDILYNPEVPSSSKPTLEAVHYPFGLVVMLFILSGSLLLFAWDRWKVSRLRRHGQILTGEVTSTSANKKRSKNGSYMEVEIRYTFRTPDGRLLSKQQKKTFSNKEYAKFLAPAAGRLVAVLYLSDRRCVLL